MHPLRSRPSTVAFGSFEFDTVSGELRKHRTKIKLPSQIRLVLAELLKRPGDLVLREDLCETLWPGATAGDFEHGLNAAVNRLRQALGDSADHPRFIETLPGRGYRFVAQVRSAPESIESAGEGNVPIPAVSDPIRPRARSKRLTAILVSVVGALFALTVFGTWLNRWVGRQAELYRLEMQGDFHVSKWTEADVRKGIEYYQRAIALDPTSATSHSGLSVGWNFLSDLHIPPHQAMPRAKAAALEAIRLDDSLAWAHVNLGVVKMQYDWDWAGAEQEFRRANALEPSFAPAQRLYGWLLTALGRFEEAQVALRRPLAADPTNDFNLMELGLSQYFSRQYEQAVEQCRRSIALDPTLYWSHMVLGWAHIQRKDFPAAIVALNRANSLSDSPQVKASLAHAYALAGRRAESQTLLSLLEETSSRRYVSPYDVATVYAGLGETEQALVWLEKACDDRSGWLALWVKVDPKFDSLRSSPRFQNLLRRVGHTT
ncbi:MAG TPA: tetratricopeptide repeat protein [Bryobacteraceae bacterium]|nr:tetratricopeptide repeat protein [Bryobacteraceae bacterium]